MTTFCIVCLYVFVCVLTAGQESNVTGDSFVCKCSYVVTCQWGMCAYVAILMGPLCKDGTGGTSLQLQWEDTGGISLQLQWEDTGGTSLQLQWEDTGGTSLQLQWEDTGM